MWKNNLSIALRFVLKDKTFSIINIAGLSASIAICVFIFHYAFHELNYDRFNANASSLYRVVSHNYEGGSLVASTASSPNRLAPAIADRVPEVFRVSRLVSTRYWFDCSLKFAHNGKAVVYHERNLYYADPSFLSMFTVHPVEGLLERALDKPYSAVLSSTAAKRYFGDLDPIGKVIHLKGSFEENDYTVTAIMTDFPSDSHLNVEILLSLSSLKGNTSFENFDAYTYLQLTDTNDKARTEGKLNELAGGFLPGVAGDGIKLKFEIQPVTDIHLYSAVQDEIKPGGNPESIYFLLLVSLCILIIAWINYVNLATSRSVSRAREVGIRKATGASRFQLLGQFVTESAIINGFSFMGAAVLVYILEPAFHSVTGVSINGRDVVALIVSKHGIAGIVFLFAGIFLSGYYPARLISGHNPAVVLKSKFQSGRQGVLVRKGLVVFQFTCALTLTITVLVFHQQFRFLENGRLGIDIDKTIIVKAPAEMDSSYLRRLKDVRVQLQANAVIGSSTTSTAIPGEDIGWTGQVRREADNEDESVDFLINVIDPDFISTYKLQLLAGRDFNEADFPLASFGDKLEPVIVNKVALRHLGITDPDRAIGAFIYWGADRCEIVGVVDDFHQRSLKVGLSPMLFTANNGPNLSLKLNNIMSSRDVSDAIARIEKAWRVAFPDEPFEYFFLDDFFARQYLADRRINELFRYFCILSVLVSSLGLFGLSSFTVRLRNKEISIRKVLGASTGNVLILLNMEFILLIGICCIIAIPLSYLSLSKWLQTFAFHIQPGYWSFAGPVIFIFVIALATVSFQTVKTAFINPAIVLKNE